MLDPANPYVLAPHLCAAAAEIPLTSADLELFGPAAPPLIADLVRQGTLRDRGGRWHPTGRRVRLAGLRGTGGRPVRIVEEAHRAADRHDGRAIRHMSSCTRAPSIRIRVTSTS